jgi:hypothetical protein
MPISSSEIAAMNGAYQGQAMNNQTYAGMIGQPPGYYGGGGGMGDHMMGSAMNRGAAVGGPLAMGALGMMGMDPMSLGIKAGIGAFQGGAGVGGVLGAGAMAAAPAAIALASVAYMGNQMMTGAQGQMHLNTGMRQSFNFQNNQGGQGFNRSDMTQVGGMLRSMTEQFGPAGEVTNFRELSQLTAKMGQMGLAQGVKDVQEFGKRFKEMVTTLKTMAKDLGTTLEGAMEFANAAKGSGIFGMGAAGRFASMARATAVSGGLAMSEVTGAASIGSQISRSMGGLGNQGAMAGVRTIGQIGTAQQMGVLSEEDIYNVTGQGGAEGRQAYAASSMQRTAGFLQSGRGRRVLASLAGKGGTLNEGAVQQLMSGDMSLGETMRRDAENLHQIGRADFIRNEGRLRGAVMGRIGGFLPGLQMMEWAKSKGIDINDMDDKSMVFAGRQLHMGRDEVDQAIKMAQNLPSIIRQQHVSDEADQIGQKLAQGRKQVGIEGIKTRFAQAQEHVNGSLQKVGQDILNQGSETLERFVNSMLGVYVTSMNEDVDKIYKAAAYSSGGKAAAQALFGGGSAGLQAFKGKAGVSQSQVGPGAGFAQFNRGGRDSDMFGATFGGSGLLHGEAARNKYEHAGFSFAAIDKLQPAAQDAAHQSLMKQISLQTLATGAPPDASLLALGKANAGWMSEFYAKSLGGMNGQVRVDAFGKELLSHTEPKNAPLRDRWLAADEVEKVRIMSGLEASQDIPLEVRLGAKFKAPDVTAMPVGGFHTDAERSEFIGRGLLVPTKGAEAPMRTNLMGLGISNRFVEGGPAGKSMSDAWVRAAGQVVEKNLGVLDQVFSSEKGTREAARKKIFQEMMRIEPTNDVEEGKRAGWESMAAASEWGELAVADRTDQAAAKISGKYSSLRKAGIGTAADLERVGAGLRQGQSILGDEAAKGEAGRRSIAGQAERSNITNMGLATFDAGGKATLTRGTLLAVAGIAGGREMLEAAAGLTAKEAGLDATSGATARAGIMGPDGTLMAKENLENRIAGMSVADLRKIAVVGAGSEAGSRASEAASTRQTMEKDLKRRGGGTAAAAAGGLHVKLTEEEKKTFGLTKRGIGPETAEQLAQGDEERGRTAGLLLSKAGITGEAAAGLKDQMKTYVQQLQQRKTGDAEKTLRGIEGSEAMIEGKKKQREESAAQRDPFGKATVDLLTTLPAKIRAQLQGLDVNAKTTAAAEKPPTPANGRTDE